MSRATVEAGGRGSPQGVSLHVAVVTRDPEARARGARRFDGAPSEWRITLDEAPPAGADVVVAGPDADIPGDLALDDPGDLIGAVRRVAEERVGRPLVIGGLPGSGRTSVAIHVAAALARTASVCLIDRDPARGVSHRLLIDEPLVFGPGDDILRAAVPVRGGFRVLTCPDPELDPVGAAREHFDALVVDGGHVADCDVALLQPSLPQARRLRAALAEARPPVLVTNRLGRGGETTRRGLERVLGRRIALELPHSPALRDAEDEGRFVPTWTRWWTGIARLVRALER